MISNYASGFSFISILRGVIGVISLILIAWIFSENRKAIRWKTVCTGLSFQLILALAIWNIPWVEDVFEFVGKIFIKTLQFSDQGTLFLFKSFSSGVLENSLLNFAITILPTIIFFSALTSVLFYFGVIQKVVSLFSFLFRRIMSLSGAESLSVIGNIFLGQTESPLLIKAYLEKMNRSELLLVMSGGMATLAGGVLAIYIKVLGAGDPVQELFYAKHLLMASVMAAPAVVVFSKILIPTSVISKDEVIIDSDVSGKNILDAISNGTAQGLKLAVNVAAMLLVFISLIALVNYVLQLFGEVTLLNNWVQKATKGDYQVVSLQLLLGYIFAPLMWIIGVSSSDVDLVGRILGEKLIMTEFIGYVSLANLKAAGAFCQTKSIIMGSYILCGFANFASIGVQIGGIGAIAPKQKTVLSQLGFKAMIAGMMASLLSATIIGMFLI